VFQCVRLKAEHRAQRIEEKRARQEADRRGAATYRRKRSTLQTLMDLILGEDEGLFLH
jgi:hypothetical protein